jgi:hypothetical protein
MSDLSSLLAPIREETEFEAASAAEASLQRNTARLLSALDAVLALHKSKTLWTHPNWTGSFDTFDICAECGRIGAGQLRKSREEWGYREGLWPCPTVAAVTAALGEQA